MVLDLFSRQVIGWSMKRARANTQMLVATAASTLDAANYFDSRMGHACVSGTEEDATLLWVSSHANMR